MEINRIVHSLGSSTCSPTIRKRWFTRLTNLCLSKYGERNAWSDSIVQPAIKCVEANVKLPILLCHCIASSVASKIHALLDGVTQQGTIPSIDQQIKDERAVDRIKSCCRLLIWAHEYVYLDDATLKLLTNRLIHVMDRRRNAALSRKMVDDVFATVCHLYMLRLDVGHMGDMRKDASQLVRQALRMYMAYGMYNHIDLDLGIDGPTDLLGDVIQPIDVVSEMDVMKLVIVVQRDDVVRSTFTQLYNYKMTGLLDAWVQHPEIAALEVVFARESGYGSGLVREWMSILLQALLHDPGASMFRKVPETDVLCFKECMDSVPTELCWLTGVALALCLRMNLHVNASFGRSVLLALQGMQHQVDLTDLLEVDPDMHRVCGLIKACTTEKELKRMGDLSFVMGDFELLPSGGTMPLTLENVDLFLDAVVFFKSGFTRNQGKIQAMVHGMTTVVAGPDPACLKRLIGALRNTPVQEINALIGRPSTQDQLIRMILESMVINPVVSEDIDASFRREFEQHLRSKSTHFVANLIRFWTGYITVPRGHVLQIYLERRDSLPSAQTCYCQLRLPYLQPWSCALQKLDFVLEYIVLDASIDD